MAEETGLTAEEKQKALIKQLAAMPEEQAVKTIRDKISMEVGKYGPEAVAAAERSLAQTVVQYKDEHKVHVTGYADVLVRNEIAATVAVDKNGVQGTTLSGQTYVGKLDDINFFAGAAGTLNDKGQAANGSAWLNAAGPVLDADFAKLIPVAQLKADAQPNKDFGLGNISATAGTVINPDGTKNNLAVLLGGTLDGKNLNLTVNDSHDFAAGKNVVLTSNIGITQDLRNGGTTVSAGGRAHNPHLFDPTTGGAIELTGYAVNLQKEPDYGVNLKGSVTFGNAAITSATTPLEAAFINAVGKDKASAPILTAVPNLTEAETQKVPTAAPASENVAAASTPATKNLDYNFLELSEKEKQKVLTLMAETYKTTHPDVSTKEAKSIILDELAAVKYHVDAHGTKSREDDTPQRVEEATR